MNRNQKDFTPTDRNNPTDKKSFSSVGLDQSVGATRGA
jgi:hypothetical protein